MLCGILLLSRRGRGWLGVQDDALSPRRVTIAFCLATLAYMFLVTVLISAADQYRYRAMVTPCYLLLVGQIVTLLLRALGARSPRHCARWGLTLQEVRLPGPDED